jgi:hypothetical protein
MRSLGQTATPGRRSPHARRRAGLAVVAASGALGLAVALLATTGAAAVAAACGMAVLLLRGGARRLATSLLLASLSVSSFLVAFDILLNAGLHHVPLALQPFVARPEYFLCQSSKEGRVPRPGYVLLLGDSYAHGAGDWLLENDAWGNGDFHSGHVIHRLIDRDVLSYGYTDASSLEALVRLPAGHEQLRQRFGLSEPLTVVIYFYEGNDVTDNVVELLRNRSLTAASGSAGAETALARVAAAEQARLSAPEPALGVRFLFGLGGAALGRGPRPQPHPEIAFSPSVNVARLGSVRVTLPTMLQGPALELTAEERGEGLRVLEACLAHVRRRWPTTRGVVVYAPSVLTCYRWESPVSVHAMFGRPSVYPATDVDARSDALAAAVTTAAREAAMEFLDVRPALRAAARQRLLHGPRDWFHLNRAGQTVLGQAVARQLTSGTAGSRGARP